MFQPQPFSHYVADKEGDAWLLCYTNYQSFMRCNEKSSIRIDEAVYSNGGWWEYPCFDEFENMFNMCGPELYEMMFELYRQRIMGNSEKAPNHSKIFLPNDTLNPYND